MRGPGESFIQILAEAQRKLLRIPNTSLKGSRVPPPVVGESSHALNRPSSSGLKPTFQRAESRLVSVSPALWWSAAESTISQRNFASFLMTFVRLPSELRNLPERVCWSAAPPRRLLPKAVTQSRSPPSSAPSSLEDKKKSCQPHRRGDQKKKSVDASWKSREEERRPRAPTIKARLDPPQSRRPPPQQGRRAAEIRGRRRQRGERRKLN